MYHTPEQETKIIRTLTEKEKKPKKKSEAQIFFVKSSKKKSK
jgi:hypothetical protein